MAPSLHFTFMDRIHTLGIIAWTIIGTIVIGIATIIVSFFSKTGNMPHHVARFWANSILWVSGIRVTIKGVQHLQADSSAIYMCNHQSNYDIPVLLGRLPVQFRWLAKAELFRIPIFSRGMKGCGYISIDRSDRKAAFASLKRAADTIRNGTSVMIFPEGTRSVDGDILPFKKGGFVLAVDAGVPIIPIILRGTWSIMPKDRWLIKPRPITLEILAPIETSGYTRKTKDELMAHVRRVMCENFNEISKEGTH